MTFGPFNGAYPGLAQHFRKANLDPLHNHWKRVFDFSKDDMSLPNPHWSLMGAWPFCYLVVYVLGVLL